MPKQLRSRSSLYVFSYTTHVRKNVLFVFSCTTHVRKNVRLQSYLRRNFASEVILKCEDILRTKLLASKLNFYER
jgi:hypothetical protein